MTNTNNKKPKCINQFQNAVVYILPYLNPTELASISSTCKTLNLIVKSITAVRSSDASRTFEKHPIPFINNNVDNHPYSYFIYTPTQTLGFTHDPTRQPWGSFPATQLDPGPIRNPTRHSCGSCSEPRPDSVDPDPVCGPTGGDGCGCERFDGDLNRVGLIWECGSGCQNRVARGVAVRVKIVRSIKKGWGLYADEFIKGGEFVCEYAGELLTTKEARKRQLTYDKLASSGKQTSALLVVREHLPSGNACLRINIDATRIGNVARFINHSCDGGNLLTVLVRSSGALLPRVCFFASRDILKDEELTFSYGDAGLNPNGSKCFCGSSCCSGIMPSEHT
ncbi:hypothetical protein M8C21_005977 [Ambrosia artemisiifolia]|uniref:Histone-lysine N-methyltransferase SUVR3 n=1 Tax=Ambrosia artemisiifolia TaxID=4212 RepID=A0AAD5CK77_AMBAR|nr:hypothetical protein M8C21_005977 [Ambrosia artemisiifolia]